MVAPTHDPVTLLGQSQLFAVLSSEGRRRLAASARVVELEPGVRLFAKGEDGDAAYLVLTGELEVAVQDADGREVWITAQGAGAVVGELAVLDGLTRAADVTASRRSRLLRIPRAAVLDALRSEPEAALQLLAVLAGRIRRADALVEETALVDLGGRLARLLLQNGPGAITLTQAQMGRMIGASREKVNRKLGEWRQQGWIEISRSGLRVTDRTALAGVAQG